MAVFKPSANLFAKEMNWVLNSNRVRVCIEELLVNAYLGAHAHEQKKRRTIPVYLEYEYQQPGSDALLSAVDYRLVRDRVLSAVEKQRFALVETMARAILDAVSSEPRVTRVYVKVSKPRALKQATTVAVSLEWNRSK